MAFDAFMWFDSTSDIQVKGETIDKTYSKQDAFEIKSFKIEVKNPQSVGSAGGGGGVGKCQLEPFEITKVRESSTSMLSSV